MGVCAIALLAAGCSHSGKVITAEAGRVEHLWKGGDGTAIAFRPDGTFVATHWPSIQGPTMEYGQYSGTWTISSPGGKLANAVMITANGGGADVVSQVDLVAKDGHEYMCADLDPDSFCLLGLLDLAP